MDNGLSFLGFLKLYRIDVTMPQTVRSQSNHVFMAVYAVFKLQCLSIKNKINSFALRLKLHINASRSAYAELQQWQATP